MWIRPSKSTIASLYSASVRLFSGTMRHLLARQGFGRTVNEQNIPLVVERVHEFLQVLLAPLCFILRHVVPLLSAFRSESLQVRPRRSRIYAVGLLGTLFRRRLFGFPSLLVEQRLYGAEILCYFIVCEFPCLQRYFSLAKDWRACYNRYRPAPVCLWLFSCVLARRYRKGAFLMPR